MLTSDRSHLVDNNDIYFLETVGDWIIVNDNYSGVIILDSNLNPVDVLKIFDGITIYSSFVNTASSEVLLFCEENKCLVLLRLEVLEHVVIPIASNLHDVFFSPLYSWDDKSLILSTYRGGYCIVDIDERVVRQLTAAEVRQQNPELLNLRSQFAPYSVIKYRPGEIVALTNDKYRTVTVIDYRSGSKDVFHNPLMGAHDVDYHSGRLVAVREDTLGVVTSTRFLFTAPQDDFAFFRAKPVGATDCSYLAVLSGKKSDSRVSRVDLMELPPADR